LVGVRLKHGPVCADYPSKRGPKPTSPHGPQAGDVSLQ
jgi:hypothetical protein